MSACCTCVECTPDASEPPIEKGFRVQLAYSRGIQPIGEVLTVDEHNWSARVLFNQNCKHAHVETVSLNEIRVIE